MREIGPSNFISLLQEWQIIRNAKFEMRSAKLRIQSIHRREEFRISNFAFRISSSCSADALRVLCSLFTEDTFTEQEKSHHVHNEDF